MLEQQQKCYNQNKFGRTTAKMLQLEQIWQNNNKKVTTKTSWVEQHQKCYNQNKYGRKTTKKLEQEQAWQNNSKNVTTRISMVEQKKIQLEQVW